MYTNDDEYRVYCEVCVLKDSSKIILNLELTKIISIKTRFNTF